MWWMNTSLLIESQWWCHGLTCTNHAIAAVAAAAVVVVDFTPSLSECVWFNSSFRRRVFPANGLHWYWQPKTRKQNVSVNHYIYQNHKRETGKKLSVANITDWFGTPLHWRAPASKHGAVAVGLLIEPWSALSSYPRMMRIIDVKSPTLGVLKMHDLKMTDKEN